MQRMQCVIYIPNKSQYLKNEERYGKNIDGFPSSFKEFFQIRETPPFCVRDCIIHRQQLYPAIILLRNSPTSCIIVSPQKYRELKLDVYLPICNTTARTPLYLKLLMKSY